MPVTNGLEFDSIGCMETPQASFDPLMQENPMGEALSDALWRIAALLRPSLVSRLLSLVIITKEERMA